MMAERREERETAKELAAKRKNKKESQPLAEQTQQVEFALPLRSSQ